MEAKSTSISKKSACSKKQKEGTESLSLIDAQDFIRFCVDHGVYEAKYKDLEFKADRTSTEKIRDVVTAREPTEDELLFHSGI